MENIIYIRQRDRGSGYTYQKQANSSHVVYSLGFWCQLQHCTTTTTTSLWVRPYRYGGTVWKHVLVDICDIYMWFFSMGPAQE